MNIYGIFHAKHTNPAECDLISFGIGSLILEYRHKI